MSEITIYTVDTRAVKGIQSDIQTFGVASVDNIEFRQEGGVVYAYYLVNEKGDYLPIRVAQLGQVVVRFFDPFPQYVQDAVLNAIGQFS